PAGSPDPAAALDLHLDQGSIGVPVHEGAGVYSTVLVPPPSSRVTRATLTARVGEAPPVTQELRFLPVRPAGIEVTTDPERLGDDDRSLEVRVRILGSEGQSLPGRTLALQPVGAQLEAPASESDDGAHLATLTRTGRGPVEMLITAQPAASRNSPRQLVVLPTRQRLPPDGLSSTTLTVLAVDEYGYPVADVDLTVQAIQGDGQVPAKATTGPDGVAQIVYTAGRASGVVNLSVAAGPIATNAGLLQLPPDAYRALVLPQSGTAEQRALVDAWSRIITTRRVEKQ
ncbi:MAG: Ig-like domain-containing protein, partial [Myxococcota bacterium]|nr:Ig-like domain-containing protein [Myxococcota bacterium]